MQQQRWVSRLLGKHFEVSAAIRYTCGMAVLWHGPPPVLGGQDSGTGSEANRNRAIQSTARITSDAFVPPKPNEFDNATLISRLRG